MVYYGSRALGVRLRRKNGNWRNKHNTEWNNQNIFGLGNKRLGHINNTNFIQCNNTFNASASYNSVLL